MLSLFPYYIVPFSADRRQKRRPFRIFPAESRTAFIISFRAAFCKHYRDSDTGSLFRKDFQLCGCVSRHKSALARILRIDEWVGNIFIGRKGRYRGKPRGYILKRAGTPFRRPVLFTISISLCGMKLFRQIVFALSPAAIIP